MVAPLSPVSTANRPPSPAASFAERRLLMERPSAHGNPVERVEVRPVREGGRYVYHLPESDTLPVTPRSLEVPHDIDHDGRADVTAVVRIAYAVDAAGRVTRFVGSVQRLVVLHEDAPLTWCEADAVDVFDKVGRAVLANRVDCRLAPVL